MKAIWYTSPGPAAQVLQYGERPTPVAGAGEVRVRLHASGVNPADANRRGGRSHAMEGPLIIPHSDGAGVVDQAGPGVDPAWIGRRVWLYNGQRNGRVSGTAAEYIALDAGLVSPLPDSTSFEAGACLGIPCMTAHYCVFSGGPVAGKTVLVTGGAGAVGHYAVQWAKWGAAGHVITTVSSEAKAAHARRAGADTVIDYRREDVAERVRAVTGGAGVDLVVDVDFGGNLATSLAICRTNGRIAYYSTRGNATPALAASELMLKCITVHGMYLPSTPLASRRQAQADIGRWLQDGGAIHTIAATFPLDRAVDAHAFVEGGGKLGTAVVRCSG